MHGGTEFGGLFGRNGKGCTDCKDTEQMVMTGDIRVAILTACMTDFDRQRTTVAKGYAQARAGQKNRAKPYNLDALWQR
jgi:hypothetical protein